MKKFAYAIAMTAIVGLTGCATNSVAINQESSTAMTESVNSGDNAISDASGMVGGWAPAFFSEFNKKELQEIVNGIEEGRISRVTISYPTPMANLANQIHDYLQATTKKDIQMEGYELANTSTVTYNMSQVVVTMYFGQSK